MFEIISNQKIASDVYRLEVKAPLVAEKFKAGQFVVLRPNEKSERIPLTIMQADSTKRLITLVVKAFGLTTRELCAMKPGELVADLLGPLGQPSEIENFGSVVIVGGGVGSAVAFAVADALKQAGNGIITVSGASNKDFVILEDEFLRISDKLIITTDDGSYGESGFVTVHLEKLYSDGVSIDRVIAAGPLIMMKNVAAITKKYSTPTIISLNPIMVDGIGMCGGCRVLVGGKVRFACVDGPEFDAHQVDFESLMRRNTAYEKIERQKEHECRLDASIEEIKTSE